MSLRIELNGTLYDTWKAATVQLNMEAVSGAFSFTTSANDQQALPVKVGDAVKIWADKTQVIEGFVEKLEPPYDAAFHDITVSGRDITCDVIDSTLTGDKEFASGLELAAICRIVLDGINLQDVRIINNAGTIAPFEDISSGDVGVTCFAFLEPLARKRQVLLNTDGEGNIVIARASSDVFPAKLQNKIGAQDNNIVAAQPVFDNTKRFYKYVVQGQLNPLDLSENTRPQDIVEQNGTALDTAIRTSRILEINAEESSDSLTAKERATWERNFRRARSFTYSATVPGHSMNGESWRTNVLVPVADEFADIDAELLIKTVAFAEDAQSGTTTTLGMTYRDAYTLEAEAAQRNANEAEAFFS